MDNPEITEVVNPPWEQGNCALWHKPCKEARDECNLWKLLPITVTNSLGIKKPGQTHFCLIFAGWEKLQSSVVMTPVIPGAGQGQKFHKIGG